MKHGVRVRRRHLPKQPAMQGLAITALLLIVLSGCRGRSETDSSSTPTAEDSTKEGEEVRSGTAPSLTGAPPDVRIELPPRFGEALAADGSGFSTLGPTDSGPEILGGTGRWSYPWTAREAPFAVIADFDGNGSKDVALLQRSEGEGRAVVVLDVPPRPRAVELRRWSRADAGESGPLTSFYLRLHRAGLMRVPDFGGSGADTTVTLPREGIEVVAWGKAAKTYWYSNGRFESVTTAD